MKIQLLILSVFFYSSETFSQELASADSAIYKFTVISYPRVDPCNNGFGYTRFKVKQSDYKMPVTYLYIANSDLMYFNTDEESDYTVRARIDLMETAIKGCYDSIRNEWLFIAKPERTTIFIRRIENRFIF